MDSDDFIALVKEFMAKANDAATKLTQRTIDDGRLPGVAAPLALYARPQGSVYIVRNATSTRPAIEQLDAWHEASHPTRWAAAAPS